MRLLTTDRVGGSSGLSVSFRQAVASSSTSWMIKPVRHFRDDAMVTAVLRTMLLMKRPWKAMPPSLGGSHAALHAGIKRTPSLFATSLVPHGESPHEKPTGWGRHYSRRLQLPKEVLDASVARSKSTPWLVRPPEAGFSPPGSEISKE